jgi:predicted NBD/HSP70 family sugar kinase
LTPSRPKLTKTHEELHCGTGPTKGDVSWSPGSGALYGNKRDIKSVSEGPATILVGDIKTAGVERIFLGIDLGGTTVSIMVCADNGEVIKSGQQRLKDRTFDNVTTQCQELSNELLAALCLDTDGIDAIGVGMPGNLDIVNGIVLSTANFDWKNAPLGATISAMLGDRPTFIENDANAALLAEWWVGSAKGKKDVVMVTLGTGIGGGVIMNNQLIRGSNGLAGEFGHLILEEDGELNTGTGVRGVAELYGSATALRKSAMAECKEQKDRGAEPVTSLMPFFEGTVHHTLCPIHYAPYTIPHTLCTIHYAPYTMHHSCPSSKVHSSLSTPSHLPPPSHHHPHHPPTTSLTLTSTPHSPPITKLHPTLPPPHTHAALRSGDA